MKEESKNNQERKYEIQKNRMEEVDLIQTVKEHRYRVASRISKIISNKYAGLEIEERILFIKSLGQENKVYSKPLRRTIQYMALEEESIINHSQANSELARLWIEGVDTTELDQLLLGLIISSMKKRYWRHTVETTERNREKLCEMNIEDLLEFSSVIYTNICRSLRGSQDAINKINRIKKELAKAKRIDHLFPRKREYRQKINRHILKIVVDCARMMTGKEENTEPEAAKCVLIENINGNDDLYSNYVYNGIEINQIKEEGRQIYTDRIKYAIRKEFDIRTIFISYPKSGRTWLRSVLENIIKMHKRNDIVFTHLMANPAFWPVDRKDFVCPNYKNDIAIFIHRDPRDVIVSQFHQVNKRDLPHMRSKESKYAHMLCDKVTKEATPPTNIDEFILDKHWGIKRVLDFNKNILASCDINYIWNYEKMVMNPYATMSELISSLGITTDIEDMISAIELNEFERMKNKEINEGKGGRMGKLYEGHNLNERDTRKIRKGIVGGWREEASREHHEEINELAASYYRSMTKEQRKKIYIPREFI